MLLTRASGILYVVFGQFQSSEEPNSFNYTSSEGIQIITSDSHVITRKHVHLKHTISAVGYKSAASLSPRCETEPLFDASLQETFTHRPLSLPQCTHVSHEDKTQ